MANETRPMPYRREAFTHVLNLAVLAAVAVAGMWDHRLWALAVPIEAAVLWIVPDLPPFRKAVDVKHAERALLAERSSFLEQLWGLRPRTDTGGLRGLLFEPPPDNPDDRVVDVDAPEFHAYLEMRAIVGRLRELIGVRGVHITENEINRCEEVINGYLRLLIACQPLERAVSGVDLPALDDAIAEVDAQIADADGPLRTALGERRALLAQQRARVPRLEATLRLFEARADALVQQLRNIHGQVLADPGMNVNEMLDGMMERQEAIADPLAQVSSDRVLEEFLRRPSVKERIGGGAGDGKPGAKPVAKPPKPPVKDAVKDSDADTDERPRPPRRPPNRQRAS